VSDRRRTGSVVGWAIALSAALAVTSGALRAQSPSDQGMADQLRSCAAEADSARRLACYDRMSTPPAAASKPPPAAPPGSGTASGAPAAVPSSTPAAADFGVDNGPLQAKQEAPKPKSMTAVVASVSTRPYGELVVTLDNGQVWVQDHAVDYFPLKPGDKVEINKGALGSYVLWVPSSRRASKVTRVY
jgi:hypothetical protein